MPNVSVEILIILLLVLLNGVLAMSELALVSARRVRLEQRAATGDASAAAALQLAESPNRFLSTVQIGITLVGIFAGAFGGATLASNVSAWLADVPWIGAYSGVVGIAIVVLLITYLTLVLGELVPKRIALQHPESIATLVARPMHAMSVIARPIVALLSASTDAVLRLLPVSASEAAAVTEEDVTHLIQEGTRAGVFEAGERDMVVSIFELADRDAGALMTPRHQLVYLDVEDSEDTILATVAEHLYTAYPVCEGGPDRVLGIVTLKTLWTQKLRHGTIDLRAGVEPALFVPDSIPVLKLTEQFRSAASNRALVIDEYGVVQGIVTPTDLLEDIVGDLDVGPGQDDPPIVRRADGSLLIDGALPTHELEAALEAEIIPDNERGQYDTLAGFLMARLGRVPGVADAVVWGEWRFEVVDMDGLRVDKVLVSLGQDGIIAESV